jgi:hypothetical protein
MAPRRTLQKEMNFGLLGLIILLVFAALKWLYGGDYKYRTLDGREISIHTSSDCLDLWWDITSGDFFKNFAPSQKIESIRYYEPGKGAAFLVLKEIPFNASISRGELRYFRDRSKCNSKTIELLVNPRSVDSFGLSIQSNAGKVAFTCSYHCDDVASSTRCFAD